MGGWHHDHAARGGKIEDLGQGGFQGTVLTGAGRSEGVLVTFIPVWEAGIGPGLPSLEGEADLLTTQGGSEATEPGLPLFALRRAQNVTFVNFNGSREAQLMTRS